MFTDEQLQTVRQSLNSRGYAVCENVFSEAEISGVGPSLEVLAKSDNVDLYYDEDGRIRRMERFTQKSSVFSLMNRAVLNMLSHVALEDFVLFKDKYNFKPPGGEGFFAHYDGIFRFITSDGQFKDGWYEYAPEFISVLVAVDDFTSQNGALEIAPAESGDFEELLSKTLGDGTPHIQPQYAEGLDFSPIQIRRGGVAIFRHTCPHRSGANRSSNPRGSIYWTYTPVRLGNHYEQYFIDKHGSRNSSKALAGEKFEG